MPATRSPDATFGAAPDRMVGRILGDRYRVLSRIGAGGMGTVYLCEHAVLHRRFAVKVLRPDLAGDVELVDRFRNEAIAASRIGQENVVDVLDFGAEEDGALYYVMEALDGVSLGAVIHGQAPLPVARSLCILEQVCRALAAAHARGVVHRDVKPDNVFLVPRDDGAEIAKLIDFGISHVPPPGGGDRLTRAGSIIGTPEYMAPEQAAGGPVDHRSDVYALGVLAFEMLTARLPIVGGDPIATLVAHRTQPPGPPSAFRPGIPPEVDALVLRALEKRPEDRFASMSAFAAEIARIRAAVGEATPPTVRCPTFPAVLPSRPSPSRGGTVALPGTDPQLAPRRRRLLRAAAASAAAAAIAALAAWWWAGARTVPGRGGPARAAGPGAPAAARPEPPSPRGLAAETAACEAPPACAAPVRGDRSPSSAARRPPPRSAPGDALKDPYRSPGPLKPDPFR